MKDQSLDLFTSLSIDKDISGQVTQCISMLPCAGLKPTTQATVVTYSPPTSEVCGLNPRYSGAVVTYSPPTSEVCDSNPRHNGAMITYLLPLWCAVQIRDPMWECCLLLTDVSSLQYRILHRGHNGAVVTYSTPISEVCGCNPGPYVGKLVVA